MNTFARTSSNRERLRMKYFFKRHLKVKKLVNKLKKYWDYYKWPKSSGGGSSCFGRIRRCSVCYNLKAIKSFCYKYGTPYYETTTMHFKKPQLIGKIIAINGKDFRIVNKR